MQGFRNIVKEWILFPFLLPVFFVVHAFQIYYKYLTVSEVALMAGVYLLLAAVLFLLVWLFIRNKAKAAMPVFLLLLFFFFWGYLHDHMLAWFPGLFISRITYLVVISLMAIALLSFLFARLRPETRRKTVFYLNVLLLLYLLADVALITGHAWRAKKNTVPLAGDAVHKKAVHNWDVYFILLDEYGSTTSLQRNIGFDNSGMDSFFRQRGFSVQPGSRSNYNLTLFSMASLLNMNYLQGLPGNGVVNVIDYNDGAQWIRNSKVITGFERQGYDVANYSIFDLDKRPSILNEELLPIGTRLITANTFYDRFLKPYYILYFETGKKDQLWGKYNYYAFLHYNEDVWNRVHDHAAPAHRRPQFVYAHVLSPHTPFYFDKENNVLDIKTAMRVTKAYDPQYYQYNLQHTNDAVKAAVDHILGHRKDNAVIIVMGDHGFRKKVHAADSLVLFQNLNAVYFPDHDYTQLYDSISNVNMFRVVLNKLNGRNDALLPDSTVLLTEESAAHEGGL